MYKQTNEDVAIYAMVKDKETKQFKKWNVMKKWGCLFVSLLYIVEQATNKLFSPSQIKLVYHYLVLKKMLGKDMYVKNHNAVLETGLQILGYEDFVVEYRAKTDYIKPENSWGTTVGSNFELLEVKTENNNHHFKHRDFDPYNPETVSRKMLSKRFYEIRIK